MHVRGEIVSANLNRREGGGHFKTQSSGARTLISHFLATLFTYRSCSRLLFEDFLVYGELADDNAFSFYLYADHL